MENKRTETVAYVDFARAFCTGIVSDEKLQLKLKACGASGKLLALQVCTVSRKCNDWKYESSDDCGRK